MRMHERSRAMSTGRLIIAPESPPATPPTSSQASASRLMAPKARASFDVQAVMPRHVPGVQGARSYRERDGAMFPFDEDMHHQNTRPTESVDATNSPGHSGHAQSNYSYPPTNNAYNHHDYFTPPSRRPRAHRNARPRRNNQRASAPISIPSATKYQEQIESQKRQAELDRQRDTARKNEKDKQKKERKDSAVAASSLGSANNGGSSSNSLDD